MNKKFITLITTLILMIALAFTLAGCDSQNGDDSRATNRNNTQETDSGNGNGETNGTDNGGINGNYAQQGRDNLIPKGQEVTANISNNFGDNHSVTLKIEEVIRGEEALDFINSKMADSIWVATAPRDEDKEYLVARVNFTLNSVEGLEQLKPARIRAYSGEFEAYPVLIASTFYNDDDFVRFGSTDINVGETVTQYIIFEVDIDDPQPMMTYESMTQDGSDGIWLMLY